MAQNPDKKSNNWVKSLSVAINLSTTVVSMVALGLIAGKWLDNKMQWPYLNGMFFTLAGFIGGTVSALMIMWNRFVKVKKGPPKAKS